MKYIKYILVAFLLFSTTSCLEDMVDTDPSDKLPEEDLVYDEESAEMALMGVYDALQDEYASLSYYLMFAETYADDFDHVGTYQIADAYANNLYPDNIILSSYIWPRTYRIIFRANKVISLVSALEEGYISIEAKERIVAEASFIRAHVYFKLVNWFGKVPLQIEPLKTDFSNMSLPRSSVEDVYGQIKKDLEYAAGKNANGNDRLPSITATNNLQYYANRDAVLALSAKVGLYTNESPSDIISTLEKVIRNTNISLVPSYGSLWVTTPTSEAIFRINSIGTDKNSLGFFFLTTADNGRYEAAPSQPLITSFDLSDDRLGLIKQEGTNPSLIKYKQAGSGDDKFYILRLADVYLMYAEANMLEGTPSSIALANEYFELVQSRAGLTPATLTAANWKDLILEERRHEFFGEGHRWFDIKRFGKNDEIIEKKLTSVGFNNVKVKYSLWPIPQSEMNANSKISASDQNAGY